MSKSKVDQNSRVGISEIERPGKKYSRVITFGTFDLLHQGHIRILERAKALGDHLIVGVSSDQLNSEKGKNSVFNEAQRLAYIEALKSVDEVFLEESLELKDQYVQEYNADLLVMGDDWDGKFDWVSCDVIYLPRTKDVSSTELKAGIAEAFRFKKVLFGDTYIHKHLDCASALINELADHRIAPVLTSNQKLPKNVDADALIYFNYPARLPPSQYDDIPKILIDHGASHLKWFLASEKRFQYFDKIITAGPDHVASLADFFPESEVKSKATANGFIKSASLFSEPHLTREEFCKLANLNANKPIIAFLPTWYLSNHPDMAASIKVISTFPNHVACLHPETHFIDTTGLNVIENEEGMSTEVLKHADFVISELSSTIYEAAALEKTIIQLLFGEYSDNNSVLFDFPYTSGTAELFAGGYSCRPVELAETLNDLLANPEKYAKFQSYYSKRILEGTWITPEAPQSIVSEIIATIATHGKPKAVETASEAVREPRYIKNLSFARNMLIAHGGGDHDQVHCSNSLEAIKASNRACNLVQLELTQGKDDILCAHDGFEAKYGLSKEFKDVSVKEFLGSKFEEKLTPMTMRSALELVYKQNQFAVCDVKPMGEEYRSIVREIFEFARHSGKIESTVLQCYCVEDFEYAIELGFTRTILPVWKYYWQNPVGDNVFEFIEKCLEINRSAVVGISLPYIQKFLSKPIIEYDEFQRFKSYWKRIFIHGAPPSEYPRIMRLNAGLFADRISPAVEFKDCDGKFHWREYLFLNPKLIGVGIDNQISAIDHFVRYGKNEGRRYQYDLPEGFDFRSYIENNPGLRQGGIFGRDSAIAHWIRYGQNEGRKWQSRKRA